MPKRQLLKAKRLKNARSHLLNELRGGLADSDGAIISVALARSDAQALADALSEAENGKSLDEAFGIGPTRGRPKRAGNTYFALAVQMFPLRVQKPPVPYEEIADLDDIKKLAKKLGRKVDRNNPLTAAWLRKIYERDADAVAQFYAEQVSKQLKLNNPIIPRF
jgi:hypothetical protein